MLRKFILGVVIAVVVLVPAFFCIGFFVPVVEYDTTVEISKPRDITWQVMRERKDWVYGFKSYEQVSGDPNEPGSRGRVTVVRDGRETTFETELVDIKAPDSAVTKFSNDMLQHYAKVTLSESGGKTTIVSHEQLEGKNAFWRSIFAMFKSRIVDTSRKNLEGLKQAVESTQ